VNLTTLSAMTQFGPVFPLTAGTKEPMRGWRWKKKDGHSQDLIVLDRWLQEHPDANWALIPTRAFVVDVDVKKADGLGSVEAAGGLEPTYTVRTPSGGFHYYYAAGDMPYVTKNNWLPGVDIRYGNDGYVVLPYSKTADGTYNVETDLEQIQNGPPSSDRFASHLPSLPDWIKTTLAPVVTSSKPREGEECILVISDKKTTTVEPEWKEIRGEVRFMFFHQRKNRIVWNHQPLDTMRDHSQSGYEFQLAMRLMCVGATDGEVVTAYKAWCRKHKLPIKARFQRVLEKARIVTAPYIEDWRSRQPIRRKHGTTTYQIFDAITNGHTRPKAIEEYTGLSGSGVRMHLKRMKAAGALVKNGRDYAIADVGVGQDKSEAA
jgi:hypothetical protein